jgi:hypothetical protein
MIAAMATLVPPLPSRIWESQRVATIEAVIVDRYQQPGGHWTTHPDSDVDWVTTTCANNRNMMRWLDDLGLMTWLDSSRLDLLGHLRPRAAAAPAQFAALAGQIKSRMSVATDKLSALLERGQKRRSRPLVRGCIFNRGRLAHATHALDTAAYAGCRL